MNRIKKAVLTGCLAMGLCVSAMALDRVVLKDGKVYEGEIVKVSDTYVQIRVTTGTLVQVHTFWMGDVESIKEDIDDSGGKPGQTGSAGTGDPKPSASGDAGDPSAETEETKAKPGVIVLPLTGMVGVEFRKEEIQMVAKEAAKVRRETGIAPVIVLELESGGGLGIEMYAIHDELIKLKQEYRIVAWVKQAISAAAATAFHCDEIYFMTEGNLGAMTAWAGNNSLKGAQLQEWVDDAGEWAEAGGRNGWIAQAMIHAPLLLSYDKDEESGEVTWYNTLQGEFDLSDEFTNLSFSSSEAIHSGFADGLADTKEALAKELDLGEWHEMSQAGREASKEWHSLIKRGREDIPLILGRLAIAQGSGDPPLTKINKQITLLRQLLRWHKKAPNLAKWDGEGRIPWSPEEIERMIRQLERAKKDVARGGRGGGG